MTIKLRCPNGHKFTYKGIQGDVAESNIDLTTFCPKCDAPVRLRIVNGKVQR